MSSSSIFEYENRDGLYNGFDLRVEDLIVWAPQQKSFNLKTPKKAILKGINTEFRKGTLTAIVGPSGSGKTTFLNFLAGRQDNSQVFRNYCNYYLNNAKIANVNEFKNIIGYVLQEDILENRNSPEQIFSFYAKMRGYKDPKKEVERVIGAMYLQKCRGTIVGDTFHRGLSGGEKKRTSIGVELISKPNLLFLDEPTTGLDSTTALDIIMNINELKKQDMTVICTIHQPSEEIMALFDKVIMLVDGQMVFDDAPFQLYSRLTSLGFHKNVYETPIEFFMKMVDKDEVRISLLEKSETSADDEEVARIHSERIALLSATQDRFTRAENATPRPGLEHNIQDLKQLAAQKNQQINFCSQFGLMFWNYTRLFFNDFQGVIIKSLIFWIIFVLVIIVFVKTPTAEEDPAINIQNIGGLIFMLSTNFFFIGATAASTTILPFKPLFKKDMQSRMYSSFAFFLAAWCHIIPFYVIIISAVAFPYFFIFNLSFDPTSNLAWFWAFLIITNFCGMSLGLILSAIAERFDDLGALTPIIILPMMFSSGFFANIFTITWPLRIYSYISPMRFSFQGLILNHFRDRDLYLRNCKVTTACLNNQSENCLYYPPSGSPLSNNCDPNIRFNFEQPQVWLNFVILVILWFGWGIIAFAVFVWRYRERSTRYSTDKEYIDLYAGRLTEDKAGAANRPDMILEELKDDRKNANRYINPLLNSDKPEERLDELPPAEVERLATDQHQREQFRMGQV